MKKLTFYLAGPIQYVEDYMTWRQEMADFLEEVGHSAEFPWGEVYHGKWMRGQFIQWLKEMEPDEWVTRVRKYMRSQVIRFDLNALFRSDALIFYLPKATKTVGSYGEQTLAYYLKKFTEHKNYKSQSIFVISEEPIEDLSYWLIGCSDIIFFSMNDFKDYFKKHYNRKKKVKKNVS